MKKILVAVLAALAVALGLVTTGGAVSASVVTKHGPHPVAYHHGHRGHHHHKRHHHQPYPGTVKTHPAAFYSPWVPAGHSAYVVGAVYPSFATGTLKLSVTGKHYSTSGTGDFLVTDPLKAGYYTVTASFDPKPGSVYAPSSQSYPLFVFPSWS